MAAERKCCVPSCGKQREDEVVLHKFPNPKNEPDRFRTWTFAVGGNILALDDTYVYNYRRICHVHFEKSYWLGSKKLTNIAVPTLQLKAIVAKRNPLRDITDRSNVHTTPYAEASTSVFQYAVSKSTDRRVYVWGLAETGALGIHMPRGKKRGKKSYKNNFTLAWYPTRSTFGERFDVTDIACGYGFTISAVETSEQHKVFGMGINTDSQIGYHAPRMGHPLEMLLSPAPIYIPYKSLETKIIGLAAGRAHSVILTDTEGAYTLGNNAYGQCGRKINSNEEYKGSMVTYNIRRLGKERITNVCCGQDHTLFITESGRVWACGWGADGQTGLGTYDNTNAPAPVKGDITSERIVKVASTGDCVLALSDKGELFGWGNSEYGQVPMAAQHQQVNMSYALFSFTRGLGKIVDVASGGSFCLIVNEQGDVFVWGYGLLGLGPNVVNCSKPKLIPPTFFGRNEFNPECMVEKVACGIGHLAAITNNGDLYMWGRNRHGCLGLGHCKDQHFPMKVAVGAHVLKVACSVDHTLALSKPFV